MSRTEVVDVLIVGAGPSGAVVADTLASSGFSVTCLEQGRWYNNDEFPGSKPEWELLSQQKWHHEPNRRGLEADYPTNISESDVHPVMMAGVGGSTLLYGGHWMRLLPSDFRMRTIHETADDWPFTYQDLAPFYDRIDRDLGISGVEGDPMYPSDLEPPMPPHPIGKVGRKAARGMNGLGWHWWPASNAISVFRRGELAPCVRWGTCETGCPAGAKMSFDITHWPRAIKAGAQLVTGARVSRITVDDQGRASGAEYFDSNGELRHQRARFVVLAANGIGTPRLLLLSEHGGAPGGLANSSGLVGKRLMLHPNAEVTGVYDEPMDSWLGPAGQSIYSLEFYETDRSRGFVGGAKWQVMPTGGPLRAHALHFQKSYDERFGAAAHDRIAQTVGHSLQWGINSQDMPEDSNTVTLDDALVDSHGIPAPKINYRISEDTKNLLQFNIARAVEAHEAAGAAEVFPVDLWPDQPGHLLGTTKMGRDPETSVVNEWGITHDVPNLAIVDGSIMPTSGAVNPTSTIVACALRTAEYLRDNARFQEVS